MDNAIMGQGSFDYIAAGIQNSGPTSISEHDLAIVGGTGKFGRASGVVTGCTVTKKRDLLQHGVLYSQVIS